MFGAAYDAYVTDAWRLDTPLPTANASLHQVLRAHADHLLQGLGPGDGVVQRVTADIANTLPAGEATATGAAKRLGMTHADAQARPSRHHVPRVLEEQRYRTAAHYLQQTHLTIEDIAFLLGFAECPPFVRAFKRWSGHTPLEYRTLHAGTC
ncbi:MAG TPA: helix-turn-helix domain-containing protein [Polyangiales bacterium]|nr:helix-turn-helix domain-containing protein [Polyangiales bacterium]